VYSITKKDVREGCIISQPGVYKLTESIDWHAQDANAKAITIACDNVTLDLGQHTIRQTNKPEPIVSTNDDRSCKGSVISGNVGIWVVNQKGITIKNGTVLDVQGVGICLKNCFSVELLDLNLRGCGGNGVVDTSFLCRNGGLFVMGTSGPEEEDILWSSDIRMINCVCTDNNSELDFVVTLGALVQNCDNVQVKNSRFNRTVSSSPEPSGVQFNVVGIDFVMSRNVLVSDCEANGNSSSGEPGGFFAWGENYKFINCRANGNFTISGHRACGFNMSNTTHLEMVNCEANSNYNSNPDAASDSMKDFSACGFRIGRAANRAIIEDCRASGNYSIGTNSPVAGFMLNSTKNIIMKNCVSLANRAATGNKGGKAFAAGFLCSTEQPTLDGGFWGGVENTFIDCVADGNTVDRQPMYQLKPYPHGDRGDKVIGDPMTGAGFIMNSQIKPKIINCKAINNHGIGIWLLNTRDALVEGNIVAGNTTKGIHDEAATGENIVRDNSLGKNA
jgi:parallel beta-helix repeat protein